ncbi:MAG: GGDEF domain-containing protein [Gemmatimonadetes bacterium]|nr:GGDEF domain-containing protein [Gemmatimonadota bacterium]
MASLALQDSMGTKALPDASDLKRALVDVLYRRHFGALLIFGIDPLNRAHGDNVSQTLKVLNSIAEFIPAPESFHITDDKIAVLLNADDACVHEIPSSLPAVIADQTGLRVYCGGIKISSEDYGLHPQMSEMIFSTAQCVLARAQQHAIPQVVWLTEKSTEDALSDISLNFFREIARINAALVQRMTLESRTDFLTGLYNRRGFEAVFTRMVRRANRNGKPLALYYMDSDSLKAINDGKGHDAGDRFIADLAQVLSDMLRGSDLLSRLAGDEFAAVVENTSRARAYAIARRLNRAVDERTEGTISIGVYHGVPESTEDALRKADAALYRVKNRGKNDIELADPV